MGLNIGANPISDMYVGENACDRIYKGSDLLFDANSEIEGLPPIYFQSRANAALKNYKIYGKTETIGGVDTGVGVQTSGTEPAGYKIPLTVTSGAQSDTYPIYIGDTQLMDEEYVDYEEQKVYRKSSNIWNNTVTKWVLTNPIIVTDNGDGSFTLSKTSKTGAYPAVKVGQILEAGKKYVFTFTINGMTQSMLDTSPILALRTTENNNTVLSIHITADGTYKMLTDTILTDFSYAFSFIPVWGKATVTFSNVVLSDISIQELTPTDPPAPLPEITVYKGNNTITSSITVGEIYLTGRINNQPPRDAGYDEATFLDITGGTTPKQLINLGQNWFNTTPIPNNLNDGNYLVFAHKRAYDPNTCDLFIVFYPASITDITLTYNSQWDSWSIPAGGYGDFTLNRSGTFPNNITASGHMQNNNNIGINNTYFVQDYKNIFTNFATLHIGSVTIPPYTAYNPI